jgi:hypothetical protein
LEGRPVTSIGGWAFANSRGVRVTIPETVVRIGEQAFSDSNALTGVIIPGTVTSIGENAFHECDLVVLSVQAGSYAEQYAKDNGIAYTIVE